MFGFQFSGGVENISCDAYLFIHRKKKNVSKMTRVKGILESFSKPKNIYGFGYALKKMYR